MRKAPRPAAAAASEALAYGYLLTTKTFIPPPRSRRVARPRLLALLSQGLAGRLILISGPAGFGKTTLLSEWALEAGLQVAWLSLDQADNDPPRFWIYVIAALQTIREGLGAAMLAALQSPQPPSIDALLTGLINDVAACVPEPLVLVLDDFHLITAPPIHEALRFLLDHLPPSMHLVLSGRADPPWSLARLRAKGEMIEVRTGDLRFTPAEVAAFLNDVMELGLSAPEVAALDERTEGWIAGLQLAALSLQDRTDAAAFIQSFRGSHRFILDYLLEEVLDRQPGNIQDFINQTAILDRLTAPLCDALTGRQDSQMILLGLERANLFLVPLDDERRWYRYHHLFADLLRVRLEGAQPGQAALLHRRASAWYEERQMLAEAVAHALAAHDVERVAHLAEENVLAMMERGSLGVLVDWLDALPGELVRSRPWLSIARAWALAYTGSFDAARPCLRDAAQALGESRQPGERDLASHLCGHMDAILCYILSVTGTDYRLLVELAQSALAQLPESDWRARGRVAVLLGLAHRNRLEFAAAREALVKALAIAKSAGQPYVAIDVLCQVARVESDQGYLHRSAATCREALRLTEAYGGPDRLPVSSSAMITLSRILYEWNDLDAALDVAQQALALARQWGAIDTLAGAYVSLIMVQIGRREFDSALASCREMKPLYGSAGPYPRRPVAMEALVRLCMNDVAGATRCVAELAPQTHEEWRLSNLISVYAAQFRAGVRASLDDVLDFLADALQEAEEAETTTGIVQLLTWQAVALHALGRIEEARLALTQALSLAEPEARVRTFIDEGVPVRELLQAIVAVEEPGGRLARYAGRLLAAMAIGGSLYSPAETPGPPPPPATFEPLSTREMEVLRLLDSSLSTPEIARELIVSTNTVRSHVKSVYAKLDAHSRTEALQRARELGLLL